MSITRFQFDSFQDLLQMSGHGPYVWACYAITLAVVLWLTFSPLAQQRRFFRDQARLQQLRDNKPQEELSVDPGQSGSRS